MVKCHPNSNTLISTGQREGVRNKHNVYVITRVGVKFGINFTSVRLSGNTIARDEAECYLPPKLTRVHYSSFKMYWYSLRSLTNNHISPIFIT